MIATATFETIACRFRAPTRSLFVTWWLYLVLVFFALCSPWVAAKVDAGAVIISSSANPVAFGRGATITVRVFGDTVINKRPTGSVALFDSAGGLLCNGVAIGPETAPLVASGACLLSVSATVGVHLISAVYQGDANYLATGANGSFSQGVSPSYTVTANAGAGGTVNPGSFAFVMRGDSVAFDFTANTGFHLVSVVAMPAGCGGTLLGNAGLTGTTRYNTDGMQFNCNFAATFSNTYAVTFAAGAGGSVSPSGTQQKTFGSTATVTVTPNAGFRLVNVTGCGVVFIGGAAITTPTTWTTAAVSSDCTVTAFFTALPTFTVTAAAGAGGSISPSSVAVAQGLTTTFTVTPASGFQIASVTGCGGTRSGGSYTTGPITAACAVTATFSASIAPPVATTTRMIEFIFPALDYYFLTSRANEIALLDSLPAFARTGQSFSVFINRVVGTQPITRFYFNKVALSGARDGHFYTLVDSEISLLLGLNPGNVTAPKLPVSEGVDSFAFPPAVEGVGGSCPSGLIPVFRVFRGNVRFPDDPNHRFTTSTAIYNGFVAKGWDGEGVKFCVPN